MICVVCDTDWPVDRFNTECSTPDWCFRCRAKTIRTGFAGGKSYFHESTEAERSRKAVAEARNAGFDPVPADTRGAFNGVSAAGLRKVESVHKKKAGLE